MVALTSMAVITWTMIGELFLLAIPIACIARTVVFEEIFREPREYCMKKSEACRTFFTRKFFYLFTCEYCFSHYVTLLVLIITRYQLLFTDWRGYVIAFFSLVFVANIYLNLYSRLNVDIKAQKVETKAKEQAIEQIEQGRAPVESGTQSDGHGGRRVGD
jgi:hypothetical protein